MVLAHLLHHNVYTDLTNARKELKRHYEYSGPGKNEHDDSIRFNSYCVSAIFALGSFLDSFATLCQKFKDELPGRTPKPETSSKNLSNFMAYNFPKCIGETLQEEKKAILNCSFNGLQFNDYWNNCKHEHPWLGIISKFTTDGYADIADKDNKKMFFKDMLIPVYKTAQKMLQIVADKMATLEIKENEIVANNLKATMKRQGNDLNEIEVTGCIKYVCEIFAEKIAGINATERQLYAAKLAEEAVKHSIKEKPFVSKVQPASDGNQHEGAIDGELFPSLSSGSFDGIQPRDSA